MLPAALAREIDAVKRRIHGPADPNLVEIETQIREISAANQPAELFGHTTIKLSVAAQLATCFIADESGRKSEKNSKDYPRKKRKKQTGEPTVVSITKRL